MAVTTRTELAEYCLRALGAPVIQIDVDTTQIEDRLDDAIQFFQMYHSDGIVESYFKHQVTALDVTNGYITLPEELTIVKRVLPVAAPGSSSDGLFNINYQMALNDIYMLRGGVGGFANNGISQYVQTKSYIDMINTMFYGMQQSRFSRHTNQLELIDTKLVEGNWVIIDGSMIIDPEANTDVYNDMWLKKYATALIKRNWAMNIKKFEGMMLPGNVTFNGQIMFDEANTEIEKLEEEIQLRFENPVDFFIG